MQKRKLFGEVLVEAKVLSEEMLSRALDRQRGSGRRLGQILEELGMVTEKDIAAALARQLGMKTVANIARASFPPELLALADAETALNKLIFPLKQEGKTLYLAMVNPLDIQTLDALSFRLGLHMIPCVTIYSEIQAAVNRHYYQKELNQVQEADIWWTILVVDAQDPVRSTAVAALKREGYVILEAASGVEGVRTTIQKKPHLIIADTVMPSMDGDEMFRVLKNNLQTRHIPVVALSSRTSAEEEARLLEAGYHDVIAKPVNPVRLIARVKHAMRLIYGDSPPPR